MAKKTRGWWLGGALGLILLGDVLRVLAVRGNDLGLDGGLSLALAFLPLSAALQFLAHDVHPPLDYTLLRPWVGLVGASPFAVKYLGLSFGVLSLAALLGWVRTLAGERGALAAGAVLAVAPGAIEASANVREYALAGLLVILFGWTFTRRPSRRTSWLIAVWGALALWTSYLAVAPLAAAGLAALARRPRDRLLAVSAAGTSLLVWLAFAWARGFGQTLQSQGPRQSIASAGPLLAQLAELAHALTGGTFLRPWWLAPALAAAGLALLLVAGVGRVAGDAPTPALPVDGEGVGTARPSGRAGSGPVSPRPGGDGRGVVPVAGTADVRTGPPRPPALPVDGEGARRFPPAQAGEGLRSPPVHRGTEGGTGQFRTPAAGQHWHTSSPLPAPGQGGGWRDAGTGTFLTLAAVAGLALALAVNTFWLREALGTRLVLAALPFLLALFGRMVGAAPPWAGAGATGALVLAGGLGTAAWFARPPLAPSFWDPVALTRALDRQVGRGDAIVFLSPEQAGYYQALSAHPRPWVLIPVGTSYLDPNVGAQAQTTLSPLRTTPRTLWLVLYHPSEGDGAAAVQNWLSRYLYPAPPQVLPDSDLEPFLSVPSLGPPQPISARFADGVTLDTAAWPASTAAGDGLPLRLTWSAAGPLDRDYTVFVHLVNAQGTVQALHDTPPVNGLVPTRQWTAGAAIVDRHALVIPPATPPGQYWLEIGLYDGNDRLPVQMGGSAYRLGPLTVTAPAACPGPSG